MNTRKLLSGVALATSLFFAASGAKADILVGLIAPLTGPVAAYGAQVKNGAEAAIEVINAGGGILGEKVVLNIVDDAGDPKQGVSAANKLLGENVRFVIGPVTSGVAIAASDVLSENGILMITPTATAPDLTNRGLTSVFRTCGRDDQQAEVAARYVLDHMKDKRIAIIDDRGTYGKGLADSFRKAINEGGIKEVVSLSLNPGEKDLSALTTRLKSENVDLIYFGGYHPEGGLLARQLNDISVNAQIIGGEGLSNTEYWAIAGQAAAGTLFTNAIDASKNPAAAEAIKVLGEKGIPAEAFTLNAYAAAEVLKAGIEKAGKTDDPAAVAAALRSGEAIPTTVGNLTYGESGDLNSPSFSLFKWEDGKIVGLE